ncbi:coiled-coil domain-containing protein 55-domain containing protein [Microdochium trichocladiopsis]|uniref:Coiled-coil domain-containing protein 55-domain containing protein n=1 Tax=Microdochium trichocladiopsis TaxID=1682393 RepID=A0A9P9BWV6_9PEZI|nr:coiled-coil domain-containing protein 55-domain containing protein [Microdochium trichocladiopsis]KAH7041172.1 coiled-coil domain-containing protein 55-domain containing protein [Microdochium trichocladiopsis]
MSKPGLSFGLNLTKKSAPTKPAPPKRKPMFGGDDDSDDDDDNNNNNKSKGTAITELDDDSFGFGSATSKTSSTATSKSKNAKAPSLQPPGGGGSKNKKPQMSMYGDLSSALESRKYQEAAEELDPSVYDYDGVYDSLKPEKKITPEDAERRPKYMKSLLASAAVRKRDALIAEEKKIARERELEGDEFADKDKFVTEAYKKQQEENRRLEEEEKKREEAEAEKNKGGGMTAFYKDLLERNDRRHAETVQAAAERAKEGPREAANGAEGEEEDKVKTEADLAREMNRKGAGIAINEDGQVVDQRELLKGGLNLGAAKKPEVKRDTDKSRDSRDDRFSSKGQFAPGGKQAMRERQTRMLEAQLEQSLKRSMQEEAEEREKVERAAKSRKTDSEISSAKERYLARKRAAEEAKKQGQA